MTTPDPSREADRWISVKERLPITENFVLVVSEHADYWVAQYNTVKHRFENECRSGYEVLDGITHWMPLPYHESQARAEQAFLDETAPKQEGST